MSDYAKQTPQEMANIAFNMGRIQGWNEAIEKVLDVYHKTPIGLRRTTQMMDIFRVLKKVSE